MAWYQLMNWASYLRIRHAEMPKYSMYYPAMLTVLAVLGFVLFPLKPQVFGDRGLVAGVLQVVSQLPGFFIAALAAVATFDRPEMDETLPEPAPRLHVLKEGKWLDIILTRRTLLTYLFSYLSALSVLIASICVAANAIAPSLVDLLDRISIVDGVVKVFCKYSFLVIFFYLLWSMLVTTLQGLYFLGERIHQPH